MVISKLSHGALAENTDYLFCPVCKIHVPCLRVDTGGWEVQCPGCTGECGRCDCHLQRYCFGTREQFPPIEHNGAARAPVDITLVSTQPRGET